MKSRKIGLIFSSWRFCLVRLVKKMEFTLVLCWVGMGKSPDCGVWRFLFIGVSASQQPLLTMEIPQRSRGQEGLRGALLHHRPTLVCILRAGIGLCFAPRSPTFTCPHLCLQSPGFCSAAMGLSSKSVTRFGSSPVFPSLDRCCYAG